MNHSVKLRLYVKWYCCCTKGARSSSSIDNWNPISHGSVTSNAKGQIVAAILYQKLLRGLYCNFCCLLLSWVHQHWASHHLSLVLIMYWARTKNQTGNGNNGSILKNIIICELIWQPSLHGWMVAFTVFWSLAIHWQIKANHPLYTRSQVQPLRLSRARILHLNIAFP